MAAIAKLVLCAAALLACATIALCRGVSAPLRALEPGRLDMPPPQPGVYELTPEPLAKLEPHAVGYAIPRRRGVYDGWLLPHGAPMGIRPGETSFTLPEEISFRLTVAGAGPSLTATLTLDTDGDKDLGDETPLQGHVYADKGVWAGIGGTADSGIVFDPVRLIGQEVRLAVRREGGRPATYELEHHHHKLKEVSVAALVSSSLQAVVPARGGTYRVTIMPQPLSGQQEVRLELEGGGPTEWSAPWSLPRGPEGLLMGFEDKLLRFTADDELTQFVIREYDGNFGTVTLNATDGRGKTNETIVLQRLGEATECRVPKSAETIRVPVGRYLGYAYDLPAGQNWRLHVVHDQPLTVSEGDKLELNCGGPVTVALDAFHPGGRSFTASAALVLADGSMAQPRCSRPLRDGPGYGSFVLESPDGDVILRFQPGVFGPADQLWEAPGNKTGKFTVKVLFDQLREYQGEVSASKGFEIH